MSAGPEQLAARWRSTAAELRRFGAPSQAEAVETCAGELETWWREYQLEALTLKEASAESGLSYSGIEKAVGAERIPNAGTKGAPRIRRADLPRKPGRRGPALVDGEPDLAGAALRGRRRQKACGPGGTA